MVKAHGKHIYLDYIGYQHDGHNDGRQMLNIMLDSVASANVRPVHSHFEEFDGVLSPPGFAAVVLLDESHITAHCYYDKGWLAFDAFTCGSGDPGKIADHIEKSLRDKMPDLYQMRREEVGRFLYNDIEEADLELDEN